MRTPQDRGALPPATLDAIATRRARGEHAGRIASDLALPLAVVKGAIEALTEGEKIREAFATLFGGHDASRPKGGG